MYKKLNKILITIIILILLYFCANFLLNYFLPQKIETAIEQFAKDNLNSKIKIGWLRVNILRGVLLRDVSLYQEGQEIPYIKISRLGASVNYAALITKKKIVLSLHVDGANLNLKRKENGEIDFTQVKFTNQNKPEVIEKKESTQPATDSAKTNAPSQPLFLVKDITVRKLNFNFQDDTVKFKKTFSNMFLSAELSNLPQIKFMLNWQDKISLKGNYDIEAKDLNSVALLQKIDLAEFNPYFTGLNIKNGSIKKAELVVRGKDPYVIKGNAKIQDLATFYPFGNLDASKAITLRGNANLDTEITIIKDKVSYRIGGSLLKAELANLPFINTLANVNANFKLDSTKLECSYIAADLPVTKQNSAIHFTAKGELNLQTLQYYAEALAGAKISQFIAAAKQIVPFNFDYAEKGDITLNGYLKGNLKQNTFDYYLEYQLKDALLKDLTKIYANGFVKNDILVLTGSTFDYKNIPVTLKGGLKNFSSPEISLSVQSDVISVDCQSKYDKNIINIEDLILKVADSKIAAQGTIEPKSSQGQFKGAGFVDVKDIKTVLNLFNLKYPLLDKVGLSGIINGKFIINGGKNPSDWEVKLAALSQNLKFYNITAKDVSLELYRNKNELIISPLRAEIGEGKIDLRVKIDSTNNRIVTNILVNDLNLAEFKKDLELKDTNLSGRLSLEANIENDSLTQWNKLNGEGKISIEQGNIWEINLLRGLGNMLFIPEFESIVFEEGHSDLIFKDENVVFDNIELKSYQMTLRGRGRISLKGDIDFAMVSEFNPNLVSASESLKKFFTNLLGQNALAIELNGTLKKPNYKIKPVLFSNLGNVQDLLENILK